MKSEKFANIRNIFCVGRNYVQHAQELNNAVPTSPFLFLKPTHSLIEANGQNVALPGSRGEVHHELEFVVSIDRRFEPGMSVDDTVNHMALGLDLTLRDVQSELKKKSLPWLLAKGFPNSAVLTDWYGFEGFEASKKHDFTLEKNGQEVQRGNIKDMLFNLKTIIEFTAESFGLDQGDIIFTGTPAGVGPVSDGDHLSLKWAGKQLGDCTVKLL